MLLSRAGVQTMARKVQVRWETESAATPMGQLAYFSQFLHLTGLWSQWLAGCPLTYGSLNAPSVADVLGTWMLSILSGHRCHSHITTRARRRKSVSSPICSRSGCPRTSSGISGASVTKPTGRMRAKAGSGRMANCRSRAGNTSGGSLSFVVRSPAKRWPSMIAAS